jgi:GAF domain-containing protein
MPAADDRLVAAVAAAVANADDMHRALLQSVVDVARAILGARASSVMLFEPDTGELVFEAVSGEGQATLIGTRFPADSGLAGWVLQSGEPLVIDDVAADPRFAREVAERSGYVPKGLIAVPLLHEDEARGVLSVLDRPESSKFSLAEMDLLSRFANQAAIALTMVQRARLVTRVLEDEDEPTRAVARLARAAHARADDAAVIELLRALERVIGR